MPPQRALFRSSTSTRRRSATPWRPRLLSARRSAESGPPECDQCGALVADLERHGAWHEAAQRPTRRRTTRTTKAPAVTEV